jgi:RND family efflux transporter MFP subunit
MKRLITLLLALSAVSCAQQKQDAAVPRQRVSVVTAQTGLGLPVMRATGTLSAKDQIPLSFKVTGVIARFFVDEGAPVTQGQLLAELERAEVDSGVRQATELSEKADRDLARSEKLYSDRVITREQVEDARTAAAVARAALTASRFNAGYAAIRAPGPGVVLRRQAEAKQLVQAGTPVLILANESRGWIVKASVSDREVVNLRLGDPVRVRLDAFPGKELAGKISQITRVADARTGTFDLEVSTDVAGINPVSGLLVKLEIRPSAPAPELIHVPIQCVIEGDRQRAWVFAYDPGTHEVKRKPVEIAFIDGAEVALNSGVTAGERLVTDGLAYLRDGDLAELASR